MKSTLQTINSYAETSPEELVLRAERHYRNEISAVADKIIQNKSIFIKLQNIIYIVKRKA